MKMVCNTALGLEPGTSHTNTGDLHTYAAQLIHASSARFAMVAASTSHIGPAGALACGEIAVGRDGAKRITGTQLTAKVIGRAVDWNVGLKECRVKYVFTMP